ncbi:hypothetical protein [Paenibacillus shenyangensis]|uniref:hypothetical protein n=1 Tax=Paenibacillus sp. A9 TaxID=1284352 RepID=UPI00037EA724|nr:hypothetical protein [Paenibacillus sp. A9]
MKAAFIWNKEELRDWIYRFRQNVADRYDRRLYAEEINRWERSAIHEALTYRGQNDQIDDSTIVSTVQLILQTAEEFRKSEGLTAMEEEPPCSFYKGDEDADTGFICSECRERYKEASRPEESSSHLAAVQGVLHAIENVYTKP